MSQGTMLVTAAVVGAVAGAAAGSVILFGPFGLRDKAAVTATIVLTQQNTTCLVRTFPNALLVGKRDLIQWNVVGTCTGIDLDDIELQYVGICGAAKSADPIAWNIFTDNSNPKGPKMRRTVASGDNQCLNYRIWHVDRVLEDPELEIVQY